jgi:poly(A) polymerase Pap1
VVSPFPFLTFLCAFLSLLFFFLFFFSFTQAVLEAYVPVIKFTFSDIDFDLPYARMLSATIPENFDIFDDSNLRNIDPKSILSLNGQSFFLSFFSSLFHHGLLALHFDSL